MKAGDSFFGLRNFVRGKINKWELLNSDPNISDVRVNSENPVDSVVSITFDNSGDFLNLLNLSDYDSDLVQSLFSHYGGGYGYFDFYGTKEDFIEGYGVWSYFNNDNWEKLNKISKYLGIDSDLYEPENSAYFADKIYPMYKKEIDEILDDYTYEANNEIDESARTNIEKDIKNFLKEFNFELIPYNGVKTTIYNLISLYAHYGIPYLSLKNLLKTIFEKNTEGHNLGGWSDNMYEWRDDRYFDSESFNRSAGRNLDKILDDLEENMSPEFVSMINRVLSKVKRVNQWMKLPKDPRYKIRVSNFNKENNKIEVKLEGPNYNRKFEISEEGFYNLLYNLDLFNLDDK